MQDAILSMDTMQQTINITNGWEKKIQPEAAHET